MEEKEQNIRLGLFVLGGVVLLLISLFFLGLSTFFVSKTTLTTTFSESVQGLSVGSQVKYRGVPVGTVSDISIAVADRIVKVKMEITLENFISKGSRDLQRRQYASYLKKEIAQGLRCRLEYAGITGMKYIDFDYFAKPTDAVPLPPKNLIEADDLYLPSAVSTFKDVSATLLNALDRLSHIRFEEISSELERVLQKFSDLLSDPSIRLAIARVNEAAEHLESTTASFGKVFDEEQLLSMREDINGSLQNFRNLTERLEKQVDGVDLAAVQEDYHSLVIQLKDTAEAIRVLSDYLEKDPQSVLRGKRE